MPNHPGPVPNVNHLWITANEGWERQRKRRINSATPVNCNFRRKYGEGISVNSRQARATFAAWNCRTDSSKETEGGVMSRPHFPHLYVKLPFPGGRAVYLSEESYTKFRASVERLVNCMEGAEYVDGLPEGQALVISEPVSKWPRLFGADRNRRAS